MGFSTFLFHTQVYTPRYLEGGQKSILFDRYPLLGDSFEEMIRNLYARPLAYFEALFYQPVKWWKAFQYVFPTVGLVLLAPVWLIPPAISLLPHLLSQAQTQLSLADIYSIPAQPFLFVGAAYGLLRLLKNPKWNARWKWIAGAAFLTAGLGVENAPRYFKRIPQERIETMSSIKELIPPDASLAAQQCLYPHFDTRRYVQLFPLKLSMATLQTRMLANPDYVFADRIGNALPYDEVVLSEEIKKMEANPAYEKLVDKENFVLFRRVKSEEKNWVVFNQ